MNTQISTQLVRLDLDEILKNYIKREFWQKKWTIFKHGKIEIMAYISYIDVGNQKICLAIEPKAAWYKKTGTNKETYISQYVYDTSIYIPIDNPEYTKQHFSNQILGSCLTIINNIEKSLVKKYAEYKHARKLQEEEEERLEVLLKNSWTSIQ